MITILHLGLEIWYVIP